MHAAYVERLVDLLDPAANLILNMSLAEAIERVGTGDPEHVRQIDGQFALIHKQGTTVRMARSIGRPMRYFLAKRAEGPCLVVAERIDEIHAFLKSEGLDGQFHPSYTRMVPAHYVVELALIGCPDPNPKSVRDSSRRSANRLPHRSRRDRAGLHRRAGRRDRQVAGPDRCPRAHRRAVLRRHRQRRGASRALPPAAWRAARSPARLKAFTLSVDGGGERSAQAQRVSRTHSISGCFLEPIEVRPRTARLSRGNCASPRTTSRSTCSRRRWPWPSAAAFASAIPIGSTWSMATAATRTSRTIRSRRTPS